MKSSLFHCENGIDTVDAFITHLREAALSYEAQHKRYVPIDYHNETLAIGVEGGHSGGYWFESQPRLENGKIVLEGKIKKLFHKTPYNNRTEKVVIIIMGITIYIGFWLPILISAAIRSCLRRRLLKKFLLTCAGCIMAK